MLRLHDELRRFNEWRGKLGLRALTVEEFRPIYERRSRGPRDDAVIKALDEAFGVNDTDPVEE